MNTIYEGGCFCGKVRYTVSGPILKGEICFCSQCRKITGGSSWPFVVVKSDSLKVTGETFKEHTRLGSSGKNVHIGFCIECSTTLFGRPELWPGIRTISACTLDNPGLFKVDMQVWTEDTPAWAALDPNVPIFLKNPP